jgi:voltage-gated potassium channel
MLVGLAAMQLVTLYGTVGYVAMGWSLLDAFYQVVITISGVGFCEVHPITSTLIRVHTMAVIALGHIAVACTLGAIVQFLTESELLHYFGDHNMMRPNGFLSGHGVVPRYGHAGGLACNEPADTKRTFVIIEMSHLETLARTARRSGMLPLEQPQVCP